MRPILLLVAASLMTLTQQAGAATLDRVKENGSFRLGYRTDARPFSYKSDSGEPKGYAVDLCRRVAVELKSALKLEEMQVEYVEVSADNRFYLIEQGRIDILCGPTSVTLSRRERVDFSLYTFVDGASVLYQRDGPADFEALAGLKVGVRSGTTTQEALRNTLVQFGVEADVVAVQDHREGLTGLENGNIAAYFADRVILTELLRGSGAPEKLKLSSRYFTHEPYALALERGDNDFRLLVDRTLSGLYRSGDIEPIFLDAFGGDAEPTDVLKTMYLINSLPH